MNTIIYLSIYLFIYLSIYLSICVCIYNRIIGSISLSILGKFIGVACVCVPEEMAFLEKSSQYVPVFTHTLIPIYRLSMICACRLSPSPYTVDGVDVESILAWSSNEEYATLSPIKRCDTFHSTMHDHIHSLNVPRLQCVDTLWTHLDSLPFDEHLKGGNFLERVDLSDRALSVSYGVCGGDAVWAALSDAPSIRLRGCAGKPSASRVSRLMVHS
jgi:hypothetical protein